jgi:mRNA-degrading endonuclease RelE of RelBE toxin-antitoxin system
MREKRLRVVFSPAAVREVEDLDTGEAITVVKDIQVYLETRPVPFGKSRIKKLAGFDPPLYRLRSGDLRAYHRTCSDEVVILAVTHRKDSNKRLKRISEERQTGQEQRAKHARNR